VPVERLFCLEFFATDAALVDEEVGEVDGLDVVAHVAPRGLGPVADGAQVAVLPRKKCRGGILSRLKKLFVSCFITSHWKITGTGNPLVTVTFHRWETICLNLRYFFLAFGSTKNRQKLRKVTGTGIFFLSF